MRLLKLVPDDTNIKFLKWRMPFFIVSLLLIAASWALVVTKGINYGAYIGHPALRMYTMGRARAFPAAARSPASASTVDRSMDSGGAGHWLGQAPRLRR